MVKKYLCAAIAAVLFAIALIGCNAGSNSTVTTEPETAQETEVSPEVRISFNAPAGVVAANNNREEIPTGASAVFTVEMPDDADSGALDTSDAVLRMTAGDGYYVREFENPAVHLDPDAWTDGSYTFLFDGDALAALFTRVQLRGSESEVYSVGGPGWTQFGGNGNGQYFFNLTLSGLKYQGKPLADATFRVCYYFYGRDASDKARITLAEYANIYDYEKYGAEQRALSTTGKTVTAGTDPVWTWSGDDYEGIPILCDTKQDDFYITWPDGVDASAVTAADISVVLYGQYGDELALEPDAEFYVYSDVAETQIALPFVHMAFTPVYTDMVITVNPAALTGADALREDSLQASYEIASVYTYQLQHGGLNPNGAVLSYQFYGIDESTLHSWNQLIHGFEYVLYVEDAEGNRSYYAEADGGTLVDSVEEAAMYDATGAQDLNVRLENESVVYDTTACIENADGSLTYRTETKSVNGEEIVLNKEVVTGWDGNDLRAVQYSPSEARANGLSPAKGYAFPQTDDFYERFSAYNYGHDYWVAHGMWPWVEGIEKGWLTDPSDGKANWNGMEKGHNFEYDGDGYYPDWLAPEAQDVENWWPWLRAGFPEGMWEAVDAANAEMFQQ